MIFNKVCLVCHNPFTSHQPATKFCPSCKGSEQDKYDARKYRWQHKNKCIDCNKPITDKAKRCGSCSIKFINKGRTRENNPRWHGGKGYDSDGYIRVLNRTHPKAEKSGYVYGHILAWEEANKMSIPDGFVIHHLNGIRSDNRPQNLVALPRKGHHGELMNQALKKRIRELEAKLAQQKF